MRIAARKLAAPLLALALMAAPALGEDADCRDAEFEGTRFSYCHVHAGADGVIEEDGMHRFAHGVIAAKGEGDIG